MVRRLATVSMVILVAWATAGCADPSDTLDRGATEVSVGRSVAKVVGPPVRSTTCIGRLPKKVNMTFVCDVVLGQGAGTVQVRVRQTDDDGSLSVTPTAALMSAAQVAAQLKELLGATLDRSFQVDCGDQGQRVRPPDSTVDCVARDRASRRHVQATIVDRDGTLEFEIGGEAT